MRESKWESPNGKSVSLESGRGIRPVFHPGLCEAASRVSITSLTTVCAAAAIAVVAPAGNRSSGAARSTQRRALAAPSQTAQQRLARERNTPLVSSVSSVTPPQSSLRSAAIDQ